MAHAAIAVPHKSKPTRSRSPRQTVTVQAMAMAPQSTKAEALRLLRKFAARSPLPLGTLRAQLIPDSSWKRAARDLGPAGAQTMARLAHALRFSTVTWKNEEDAIDWLLGEHSELSGATPFSMLRTESGARAVEYIMGALEYGFPA